MRPYSISFGEPKRIFITAFALCFFFPQFIAITFRHALTPSQTGQIPFEGYEHLLARRFLEAINDFLAAQDRDGPSEGLASALAHSYHQLGFQTLADQVRRSVRTVRGNQWMFRLGHPADHPLRIRKELLRPDPDSNTMPLLCETTAVRMDFSHSAWSDIFFLGMDFPEGARVLNVSVDLGVSRPRQEYETADRNLFACDRRAGLSISQRRSRRNHRGRNHFGNV